LSPRGSKAIKLLPATPVLYGSRRRVNLIRRPGGRLQCGPGGDNLQRNEGEMATELAAGDKAPKFDLEIADGLRLRLADLKGTKCVVYFYPKDDTAGCTKEAIDFNALAKEFAACGTRLVGVSPDTLASHDKFRGKHELALPLGADPERAAIEAYGVWREKSMYGRKYMGVERSTFLIDAKGRIAQVWRKVKVPGHAKEVLAAAAAL
jgi:peroxiredoxin Q/BCP